MFFRQAVKLSRVPHWITKRHVQAPKGLAAHTSHRRHTANSDDPVRDRRIYFRFRRRSATRPWLRLECVASLAGKLDCILSPARAASDRAGPCSPTKTCACSVARRAQRTNAHTGGWMRSQRGQGQSLLRLTANDGENFARGYGPCQHAVLCSTASPISKKRVTPASCWNGRG